MCAFFVPSLPATIDALLWLLRFLEALDWRLFFEVPLFFILRDLDRDLPLAVDFLSY
jgi:hypothetical protein